MDISIDLVLIGNVPETLFWKSGSIHYISSRLHDLHEFISSTVCNSQVLHWLFWDARLGMPDETRLSQLVTRPGDVWHAGLKLGQGGRPGIIDFFAPTWMLNRDPDPSIEATSWRLSLRACLVRVEVLRQTGGLNPAFATLEGAALEMGHRWITRGVFMRHIPWMVERAFPPEPLPFEDELRFLRCRAGKSWNRLALARAVLSRYISPIEAARAWAAVRPMKRPAQPTPYRHRMPEKKALPDGVTVSVLIPTIDRYSYLRTLLTQLRAQTVLPQEIIIVDQTEKSRRDDAIGNEFPDLPLKIITLDKAGQCSSRNAGLQIARGEFVLFIDDDDEIEPDLIERHLNNLALFQNEVSSGTAHEVGAGALPENFTYRRASDVFPTNNTMIYKAVLQRSGLFDLAYDRMQRADGDLGMRVYLSGAFMVYDPEISVLHHHAPRGGLRTHRARVVTYASSRQNLTQRHLPSISEIYLGLRYFTPRQVREDLWMRALGTFATRGGIGRKALKSMMSLALLPDTIWQIRRAYLEAIRMREYYPQIPSLDEKSKVSEKVGSA